MNKEKISFGRWLLQGIHSDIIGIIEVLVFFTSGIGQFLIGMLGFTISFIILITCIAPWIFYGTLSLWDTLISLAFAIFFGFVALHGLYREEVTK